MKFHRIFRNRSGSALYAVVKGTGIAYVVEWYPAAPDLERQLATLESFSYASAGQACALESAVEAARAHAEGR